MYFLRMFLLLIVLSGLVHIFSVLTVPNFADHKVWQRIESKMQPRDMTQLSGHAETVSMLGRADPAMAYGICYFDLKNGPVTVTSDGPTNFWNITIFNNQGQTVYSLHDGVSKNQQLNLEIRNRADPKKEEVIIENDNLPIPASRVRDGTPVPSSRPLSDKELESEKAEAEAVEEDDSAVRAILNVNQAFVVFKIFRSSTSYSNLIRETLEAAECK